MLDEHDSDRETQNKRPFALLRFTRNDTWGHASWTLAGKVLPGLRQVAKSPADRRHAETSPPRHNLDASSEKADENQA